MNDLAYGATLLACFTSMIIGMILESALDAPSNHALVTQTDPAHVCLAKTKAAACTAVALAHTAAR
jgi:hypothetical protein